METSELQEEIAAETDNSGETAATPESGEGSALPGQMGQQEQPEQPAHAKPMLTVDQQIAHLKSKGITFEMCGEDEAARYLADSTWYFNATSYRALFQKRVGGELGGQYVGLDFGHLVQLSRLDGKLRQALLPLTLDVEHAAKTKIVREATQREGEDGYTIVADYLASLNHDERRRRELELSRLANDAYCGALVDKYAEDMPIWVYAELLTFGAFTNLYRFCADRWADQAMKDEHYLLRQAKDARNAYAHSSAIVNGFAGQGSRIATSPLVGRALAQAGVSKRVRTSKMRNPRLQQIATLLYAHTRLVTNDHARSDASRSVAELAAEMSDVRATLDANDAVRSSLDFLAVLFDKWF